MKLVKLHSPGSPSVDGQHPDAPALDRVGVAQQGQRLPDGRLQRRVAGRPQAEQDGQGALLRWGEGGSADHSNTC